ncbi:MAG: hypothetical protein SPI18_02460 [Prevotella sp.]|nr:hypothetical protein [Prevotella sp.]MDY6130143.1 hypothetical protein [Prevotella sp.]
MRKIVIDDYSHSVTDKMDAIKDKTNAPRMEKYGFSREDLDDYLFDKQALIDKEAERLSNYTMMGFLFALPIIVASAFWESTDALLICCGIGAAVVALYVFLGKLLFKAKLKQMHNNDIENYIKDVLAF